MLNYFQIILFFCISIQSLFAQYNIQDIPYPKKQGQEFYVSNPDGILTHDTEGQLNIICNQIDSLSGAEFAIVVVNDYEGDDDFEFALKLFNTWGIGKKESDNGLLLFIAKDRREYRFISGYGMERLFPDAFLKRAGEKYLVPNFRNFDYDNGLIQATLFIQHILTSPDSIAELEAMMPEAMPFWSFKNVYLINSLLIILFFGIVYMLTHWLSLAIFKDKRKRPKLYVPVFQGLGCMLLLMFFSLFVFAFVFDNLDKVYTRQNIPYFIMILCSIILSMKLYDIKTLIGKWFLDEEEKQQAYKQFMTRFSLPLLLSPLAWLSAIHLFKGFANNRGRFTAPDDSGNWERVVRKNRKIGEKFLSEGQKMEEKLKSRIYEIWKNQSDDTVKFIPWEINGKYKECPECHYFTLVLNCRETVINPTYKTKGEGRKLDKCQFCEYKRVISTYSIAKKVKSTSSSGGGSSRSGGGSSSGSSGSFGGGSSGGGGAGGRW